MTPNGSISRRARTWVAALAAALAAGACGTKAPSNADDAGGEEVDTAGTDDGAAPDLSVEEASDGCPGGVGCPCVDATDCDAALCLQTPEGKRCSQYCGDGSCPAGWSCLGQTGGGDATSFCVVDGGLACQPCDADAACRAGGHDDARCVRYGDEGGFCGVACATDKGCPAGYACRDVATTEGAATRQCVLPGAAAGALGVCGCSPAATSAALATSCWLTTGQGGAARRCKGSRSCGTGALSACSPLIGAAAACADVQCLDATTLLALPDGKGCDDGRACTVADTCLAGLCQSGAQVCACEPGHKPCAPPAGDAQNLCRGKDYCAPTPGAALPFACLPNPGETKVCDTSLDAPCAKNACAPLSGACTLTAVEATVEICDLPAVAGGAPGCRRELLPPSAPLAAPSPCDDGLACSLTDLCTGGACIAKDKAGCACLEDADCADDGDKCNGLPYCDASGTTWSCKINPATVVVCDGSAAAPCTASQCQKATGACASVDLPLGATCSDGVACTKGDACDGAGACSSGTWVCCTSDADCKGKPEENVCVGLLFCNKQSGGCEPNPATALTCASVDDSACASKKCDAKVGACTWVPTVADKPIACDDGDPCTAPGTCDGKGNCGVGSAICPCKVDADCQGKEDGDACNGTLYCDAVAGACKANPASLITCPSVADTACLRNECDVKSGKCAMVAVAAKQPCDADGAYCTAGDACDGQGACAVGAAICVCQQDADCAPHEDGDGCNGTLYCDKSDAKSPVCKVNPKTLVSCPSVDDGPCQKNACQPKTGQCALVKAADGKPCDDGSACSAGDACSAGSCKPGADACLCQKPGACDDGNACTIDSCDAKAGCGYVPKNGACATGDPCTVGACNAGKCVAGDATSGLVLKGGAGVDNLQGVAVAADGRFAAVGVLAGEKPWLLLEDAAGKVEHDGAVALGAGLGGLYAIRATADGGWAAVGYGGAKAPWDAAYLRLSATGAVQASKTFPAGAGEDVWLAIAAADGDQHWLAGQTASKGAGGFDLWVARIVDGGATVWEGVYGLGKDDSGEAALPTPGDGVLVVGSTQSHGGATTDARDGWLLWFDAKGVVLRDRRIGGVYDEAFYDAVVAPADVSMPAGIFAVGQASVDGSGTATDGYVARVSAAGDLLWQRVLPATAQIDGLNGATVLGGALYASGVRGAIADKPESGAHAWLLRMDPLGNLQWQRSLGAPAVLRGHGALALQPGGKGVVFAGQANAPGDWKGAIFRTDGYGRLGCDDGGKCAGLDPKGCDDGNACTADDCAPADGSCLQQAQLNVCDAKGCTVGDACVGASCKAGGKAKLWQASVDGLGKGLYAAGVVGDGAGGVVVALAGPASTPSRVVAYAADGKLAWTTPMAFGPSNTVLGLWGGIDRLADGRYVVGGNYQTAGGARRYSALLSSQGKVLLEAADGNDGAVQGVAARLDGGWWVAGYTGSTFGTGQGAQAYLLRMAPNGNVAQGKGYGGPNNEFLNDVLMIPSGGALAVGSVDSTALWAIAVDDNANLVGELAVKDPGGWLYASCADGAGGYVLAGARHEADGSGRDAALLGVDASLKLLWSKTFDTGKDEAFHDVAAGSGGLVAAGFAANGTDSAVAAGNGWIVRLDAGRQVLGTSMIDAATWDSANDLVVLPDGGVVVAGEGGTATAFDPWIARVDPWGHSTCAAAGVCASTAPWICDDGQLCTAEACDPKAGCAKPSPLSCDDGDTCTLDSCDAKLGCQHAPSDGPCQDGDPCTGGEACKGGTCQGGVASYRKDIANTQGPSDQLYAVIALAGGGWVGVGPGDDAKKPLIVVVDAKGSASEAPISTAGAVAANGVGRRADGGLAVVGWSGPPSARDGWFARLDKGAAVIKQATFGGAGGGDQLRAAVATSTGWIAVGTTDTAGGGAQGGADGWALGLDDQGGELWSRKLGTAKGDDLFSATDALDGGVAAAGWAGSHDGIASDQSDAWFVLISQDGDVRRERRIGTTASESALGIAQAAATSALPAGYWLAGSQYPGPLGKEDGLLTRVDRTGAQLWSRSYGTVHNDALRGAFGESDGGCVVAGARAIEDGKATTGRGWLMRLDSFGNVRWQRSIGDGEGTYFHGPPLRLAADAMGGAGFVLAGEIIKDGKDQAGLLLRVDALGFPTCAAAGACAGTSALACDDGKLCTADDCTPETGGCSHAPHSGPCSTLGCTLDDACFEGQCLAGGKQRLWEKVEKIPGAALQQPHGSALLANGDVVVVSRGFGGSAAKVAAWRLDGSAAWSVEKASAAPQGTSWPVQLDRPIVLADGRIAISGNATVTGKSTPYVMVLDGAGKPLLDVVPQPSTEGVAESLAAHADGGLYLVGYKVNAKGSDGLALRLSASGATVWGAKLYGGADGYDDFGGATAAPGGKLAVVGTSDKPGKGGTDGWLLLLDDQGAVVAEGSAGSAKNEGLGAVAALTGGGFLAVGHQQTTSPADRDGFLARFTGNGLLLWAQPIVKPGAETLVDVQTLPGGDAVVVGYQGDGFQSAKVDGAAWALRVSLYGHIVHSWTLDTHPSWDSFLTVAPLPDGSLLVGGERGTGTEFDGFVARLGAWGQVDCQGTGVCAQLPDDACVDDNPCTYAGCDPVGGCSQKQTPDATACGVSASCVAGACK